jgi:uncharacterized repeat protein (TIGR01451 family)
VTLTFTVHQTAGLLPDYAFVDEVSAGSTNPDAWVQIGPSFHALPGSQVTIPITLGNQGRVPAAGAQLTLTLPAGLTFVSASISPTSTDPALTWNLGDLAAQSTATIWVTLQVDPTSPTFTSLNYTTILTLSAPELETTNNTANGVVHTDLQVYLPMIKK